MGQVMAALSSHRDIRRGAALFTERGNTYYRSQLSAALPLPLPLLS